jgi:hypothetical protein
MTLIPDPAMQQGPSNARLRLMVLAVALLVALIVAAVFLASHLLDRRLERETGRVQARISASLPDYLGRAPSEMHPLIETLAGQATGDTANFYAAVCTLAALDFVPDSENPWSKKRDLLESLVEFLRENPAPSQRAAIEFAESHPILRAALASYGTADAPAAGAI